MKMLTSDIEITMRDTFKFGINYNGSFSMNFDPKSVKVWLSEP